MRRRWKVTLVASAALVVLLGGAYIGTTDAGRIGDTDGPAAYAPSCLPGDGYRPNPDVCAHAFGARDESHGEPYLAVHPDGPDIIVMGTMSRVPHREAEPEPEEPPTSTEDEILAMVLGEQAEPAPEPIGPPCSGFGLCLHVTRDAGTTWHQVDVFRPDGFSMSADPTLVFTSDGTLHMAGHRSSGGDIVYARTSDLGASWSTPQYLVMDQQQDRPWLSVNDADTLVLTWHYGGSQEQAPEGIGILWSDDHGETWNDIQGAPTDCGLPGPARPLREDHWIVACDDAPIPGKTVFRFQTSHNHTSIATGWLNWGYGINLISNGPNSRLVMTDTSPLRWTGNTIHVRYSDNDGITWSQPIDLRRLTDLDDDWDWVWLSWADTDNAGNLHALIVGGPGEHCYNQRCNDPLQRQVVWVATDPESGDLLGDALLTPTDPDARARERERDLHTTGDDYHHVIAHENGVLIAWGHDGWTDLSWIAPLP